MTSALTRFRRNVRAYVAGLRARPEARRQLHAIRDGPGSPFGRTCRPGFMRGIDFYSAPALEHAFARALGAYRLRFGRYPDIAHPERLNEKIIWRKFFGEFKVPEAGNKLLTAHFLPEEARSLVKVPEIVWHAPYPALPDNHAIPPGDYYLKANHGCGMYRRIRYPLTPDLKRELQALCHRWLRDPYGLYDGEWWYNVFKKEILLERDVCGSDGSTSWNLFVIHGRLESIALIHKPSRFTPGASLKTRMDPNFRVPEDVMAHPGPKLDAPEISTDAQARLRTAAELVGAQFDFVRVDFLLDADENVYLNEVTFTPGNGLIRRAEALEVGLGRKWVL